MKPSLRVPKYKPPGMPKIIGGKPCKEHEAARLKKVAELFKDIDKEED